VVGHSVAAVRRALGISVHTGWAACVVIEAPARAQRLPAGTPPTVIGSELMEILPDPERFCFHAAAELGGAAAARWIAQARSKARANAGRALARLAAHGAAVCAIVAKDGEPGLLSAVLASHPRIHLAEGCFYRDVLRDACGIPVCIIPPSELDASACGKLAAPPWGRDQKLATLAAWRVLAAADPHSLTPRMRRTR
jgi:hypothetical protein